MTSVKVFTAGGWRELGYVAPSSVPIEAWHVVGAAGEPAFQNSWVNYGSGYGDAAFRKRPDGVVELAGMVKSGTANGVIFTLPAGYRPVRPGFTGDMFIPGAASDTFSQIRVRADGSVFPFGGTQSSWVTLHHVRFPTDQATFPTGPAAPEAFAARVTSLPASPVDGQEVVYVADAANGVLWRLRYNAGAVSVYKWEFVGGSPLFSEVGSPGSGDEGTASTSYTTLTSSGPNVALPLAGDYDVEVMCAAYNTGANIGSAMSYQIGATAAVEADAAISQSSSASTGVPYAVARRRKTGLAAVTLSARYRSAGAGTANFRWGRRMTVWPVRVG